MVGRAGLDLAEGAADAQKWGDQPWSVMLSCVVPSIFRRVIPLRAERQGQRAVAELTWSQHFGAGAILDSGGQGYSGAPRPAPPPAMTTSWLLVRGACIGFLKCCKVIDYGYLLGVTSLR